MSDSWEWLPVAGALGGAAIGGVVTVLSLRIQGRLDRDARTDAASREDRLRVEDRRWQVHQQNVDERRALYARLLKSASELIDTARILTWPLPAQEDEQFRQRRSETQQKADGLLEAFRQAAADVDVASVEQEVIRVVEVFSTDAVELVVSSALLGPSPVLEAQLRALEHNRLPELRAACRHDLYGVTERESRD